MTENRKRQFRVQRVAPIVALLLAVVGGAAWYAGVGGLGTSHPPANSVMVIAPYDYNGTWVFNDARAGLEREPFVAGVPEMIDLLVRDIPNAKQGFRLLFSAQPFPGHQKKLTWERGDGVGNYYSMEDPSMEGWVCPAMFKYFEEAPPELYVKAEPKT